MSRVVILFVLFFSFIDFHANEGEMPIIAFYGVPDTGIGKDYQLLSECGFTVNQRYYPNINSLQHACRLASLYGIKILGRCPEFFNAPEIAASKLKDEVGFFGYMMQDEPSAPEIDDRQKDINRLLKHDDKHYFYINLLPYYYPEWVEPRLKVKTQPEYIKKLASTSCQQISFDFYPITTAGIRPMWYHNLEMIRYESLKSNKPFWAFVLSVPHNVPNVSNTYYPQPSPASLRLQIYSNLVYGAQAIQYFTYWTPPREAEGLNYHDGPISADGKKTKTYDLVRQMNQELKTVARLFYGAKVVSVHHLGSIPEGATRQPYMPINLRSLKIVGRQGAVISQIEKEGHRYLAIVNKSHEKELTVRIRAKNSLPRHISKSLQEESIKPNYIITAGDILLFKLK